MKVLLDEIKGTYDGYVNTPAYLLDYYLPTEQSELMAVKMWKTQKIKNRIPWLFLSVLFILMSIMILTEDVHEWTAYMFLLGGIVLLVCVSINLFQCCTYFCPITKATIVSTRSAGSRIKERYITYYAIVCQKDAKVISEDVKVDLKTFNRCDEGREIYIINYKGECSGFIVEEN